jgi:hypothetical protein
VTLYWTLGSTFERFKISCVVGSRCGFPLFSLLFSRSTKPWWLVILDRRSSCFDDWTALMASRFRVSGICEVTPSLLSISKTTISARVRSMVLSLWGYDSPDYIWISWIGDPQMLFLHTLDSRNGKILRCQINDSRSSPWSIVVVESMLRTLDISKPRTLKSFDEWSSEMIDPLTPAPLNQWLWSWQEFGLRDFEVSNLCGFSLPGIRNIKARITCLELDGCWFSTVTQCSITLLLLRF